MVKLGEGGFGEVLSAKHHQTGAIVAVKVASKASEIDHEYRIYELLRIRNRKLFEVTPIPTIYGSGKIGELAWLSVDLLGPSIDDILHERGEFSIETIMLMAIQMIICLDFLHGCRIVHGDVKGENFALSTADPEKIVVFDLGLAQQEGTVIEGFSGTLLFASVAAHEGRPMRAKDDFESLAYTLADFYKPLSWNKWPKEFEERVKYGLQQKKKQDIFEMTTGFFELTLLFMHIDSQSVPKSAYMKNMFSTKLDEIRSNRLFDWES